MQSMTLADHADLIMTHIQSKLPLSEREAFMAWWGKSGEPDWDYLYTRFPQEVITMFHEETHAR